MPDVTYYFNAYTTAVWTNPNNMVDGSLTTYGSVASNLTQVLTGNDCPGTDLGTITKVELRAYGYADADDKLGLQPVFAAGAGTNQEAAPGTSPVWSAYYDITTDTNAPSPWTWGAVQTLDVNVIRTSVGKGNTMYCAKVEIRVTYWAPPVSDIDVGAPVIDRASQIISGSTWINKENPANASGTLHSIKVWAVANIIGLKVGTFYVVSGNTLKCRDGVVIGNVEAGAERTFTGLSIIVQEGDYIGGHIPADGGQMERSLEGYAGIWLTFVPGDHVVPGDEYTYNSIAGDEVSLYGYGDIAPPVSIPRHGFVSFQNPGIV